MNPSFTIFFIPVSQAN